MSGGSVYNPQEQGLGVPFEMTFGLHSDAGFSKEDELIGTLGIYTTGSNNGKLNAGISRYASRDLADMVLTGLQRDISAGLVFSGRAAACGTAITARHACRVFHP